MIKIIGVRSFASVFIFAVLAALQSVSVFAGVYDELGDSDKARVQNGEQVFLTEDVDGSSWPRVKIYQRTDATPEESIAVMSDFESQPSYISDVLYCKIVSWVDHATNQVAYKVHVPVLADEKYTVQNHLAKYDGESSYRLDWTMVRADSASDIAGSARFEPLGTGTIFAYTNFVNPTSSFAGFVKGRALKSMAETVKLIGAQINKEHRLQDATLAKELTALRAAVN